MEYSLSALEDSLLGAHVADGEQTQKCHESVRERMSAFWQTTSHILVALFVTVALASSLAILEFAITSEAPVDRDVSRVQQLGTADTLNTLFGIKTAHAAGGYDALIVSVSPSSISLSEGGSADVTVQLKNIGVQTWTKDGNAFVSAYTWDPKYHVSPYRGLSWRNDHQTGALQEALIAPGEIGTFAFSVYAPPSFEGELTETFRLAAEDVAWLEGGMFTVSMSVGSLVVEEATPAASVVDADAFKAEIVAVSAGRIVAKAGQPFAIQAAVKNTGTTAWHSYAIASAQTALAAEDVATTYHPSWVSSKIALARSAKVAPGAVEIMDFSFRAPSTRGQHTVRFQIVANDAELAGGVIEIPVEVTSGAAELINAPIDEAKAIILQGEQIAEPRMRIGIDTVVSEVILSADGDVRVISGDDKKELAIVTAGQAMRANWNGEQYVFETNGSILLSDEYLRFEGVNGIDTLFTLSSFSDVRSYNTKWNDNVFRDTMELRFNTRRNRTWIINELPIDHYLYGLDETSGDAPPAYLEALVTAARTYALYHFEHKTKYDGEFIDMKNTAADQVYHGYNAEVRRPSVVKAVDDTAGVTVQYAGDTIIAAYFSRSDGRTRDFAQVWGRDVPYAKSVAVPCEVGRTMWGHGVGMSAGGALCMANDGSVFDEILKYFYTGVDLVRRW